jgi:hypothetical protein
VFSLLTRPRAVEDTLHPPGDAEVPRDHRHHTVVMSGASSAFIPTTL